MPPSETFRFVRSSFFAVLVSSLAGQSLAGLVPTPARSFAGSAVLVTDPDDAFGSARVDVRLEGHRYELWARGPAARALRTRLAGESVEIVGEISPRPEGMSWLVRRHIVGRVTAESIAPVDDGDPLSRAANSFRRLLARGATVMDPDQRALFAGFVLGDDRFERDEVIDDFRAAGLSHLLAVSGENVA